MSEALAASSAVRQHASDLLFRPTERRLQHRVPLLARLRQEKVSVPASAV